MISEILTLKFSFSSGHRYWRPEWSLAENKKHFGKCIHFHGHNYTLEVKLQKSDLTREQIQIWTSLIQSEVSQLDHQSLTESVDFFKDHIPTTENLALYFRDKLSALRLPIFQILLYEGPDLWTELLTHQLKRD